MFLIVKKILPEWYSRLTFVWVYGFHAHFVRKSERLAANPPFSIATIHYIIGPKKNPDVVLFLASRKEITSWKDWWCHLDEPRQLFPLLYSLEERAPYGRRTSLPIGCGVVVFLTHVVWSTKCFLEAPILPGPTLIILNKHAYTYW